MVGSQNYDDPSTVEVSGLGIERGRTGEKSTFVIDTTGIHIFRLVEIKIYTCKQLKCLSVMQGL